MEPSRFKDVAAEPGKPVWGAITSREGELPTKTEDIRSPFERDFTRILHSTAYRRLKHKTQVFFAPQNDHICTRMEHVNHVSSISYTIGKFLGLNLELISAIAIGHDVGHAPFGHAGEKFIKDIAYSEFKENFWHEMNSLRFIDDIETLEDISGYHHNLLLTYAVRDGIVCHCGEVDENKVTPRSEVVDLRRINKANSLQSITWEGCVVKISDKIAYLGRDIEDAISLRILDLRQKKELLRLIRDFGGHKIREINNSSIIHGLIVDLCTNSNPQEGLYLSDKNLKLMDEVKKFNYEYIYFHPRLENYKKYAKLIIESLYCVLIDMYSVDAVRSVTGRIMSYPCLCGEFVKWLIKYGNVPERESLACRYSNSIIYQLENEIDFRKAALEYISGMTDNFAIKCYQEITTF